MQYIFIVALSIFSFLHDIHISKTDIHLKSDQSSIQITAHVYLDDLEEDMRKYGFEDLKLCTKYESTQGDSAVVKYFNEHLKLKIDDTAVQYDYVGKEIAEDYQAAWIYFEVPVDNPKNVEVENTILLDLYKDQKNIVMLKKDYTRVFTAILDEAEKTLIKDL